MDIKEHNSQYYSQADRDLWETRTILNIAGMKVPQYIFHGHVDPYDHSILIYEQIMKYEEYFKNKKFLDIGTCAGINNLLLTKAGFHVEGLDNNIYSLNCSLYTMDLNNVYYKVHFGDHNDIEKMDYDILLVNQMNYIAGFMDALEPILKREKERGRESIMFMGRL